MFAELDIPFTPAPLRWSAWYSGIQGTDVLLNLPKSETRSGLPHLAREGALMSWSPTNGEFSPGAPQPLIAPHTLRDSAAAVVVCTLIRNQASVDPTSQGRS